MLHIPLKYHDIPHKNIIKFILTLYWYLSLKYLDISCTIIFYKISWHFIGKYLDILPHVAIFSWNVSILLIDISITEYWDILFQNFLISCRTLISSPGNRHALSNPALQTALGIFTYTMMTMMMTTMMMKTMILMMMHMMR